MGALAEHPALDLPTNGTSLRFTVLGKAAATGSKRGFQHPRTGRIMVVDANKNAAPWKSIVASVAHEHYAGAELLTGPLEVSMTFYVPRPKGHYGTGRNMGVLKTWAPRFPAVKPDLLKLARGVEDALTGIVWRDDAQITDELLFKRYGTPERLEIEIREL